MTTDTATRIISKHESLVVLCTYNILFTNDICCWQIIECLQAMKRTPYYKHTFKKFLNDAEKARRAYEKTINSVIGADRGDFSQIEMTGIWKRLTSTLKCSTGSSSRFLTIWGGEYSSELARFELARTLCEYACLQFDERIAALKRKMLDSKDSHWNI